MTLDNAFNVMGLEISIVHMPTVREVWTRCRGLPDEVRGVFNLFAQCERGLSQRAVMEGLYCGGGYCSGRRWWQMVCFWIQDKGPRHTLYYVYV